MKRILYTLLTAAAVLFGNYFYFNGTLEATIETPTPISSPTLVPLPGTVVPTPVGDPTIAPAPVEERDPYGEVYFSIVTPPEKYDPSIEVDQSTHRLARLPGSCIVGLIECPEVRTVPTPFNMKDVWNDGTGIVWSPDGWYGLLVTHFEDELSAGKTKKELDKIQHQSPSEFNISPSTLYMFDAQTDTWSEVYRMERKFFFNPKWSPDGQWIAFTVNSSVWAFHSPQKDDGVYVIHPDGSGLKQLSGIGASTSILGWIGNSILLQRAQGLYPTTESSKSRMEMLTLDGETKFLFETDRLAIFTLSPDGGAILAADAQGEFAGSPVKTVDVLALDGSVVYTFGTFTNHTASIYPTTWSRDGSLVAFANLRRAYVGPREGQGAGFPNALIGIPPDGPVRDVYLADDTYAPPSFSSFQFSSDNKYLLMDVYEGIPHFVVVALETGQSAVVTMKGMTDLEQAYSFSWRP